MLAVLKDPRSRVILFLPSVMQSLIFGYAATYDLNDVPYAVLDQDHSAASRDLIAEFDGSGIFRRKVELQSPRQIASVINNKDAFLVLHIAHDLERPLTGG